MSQSIQVNGQTINYPETGDTNWADDATNFAIQTSAALGKIGLSSGTSVDITQTLDVTGNTTLDANLSVGGNTTLTGNLTVNGNTQLGNANTDTIGVTGIVNIDSGVLYVDPVNNRVGINDTTPSEALDVTGNIAISGNGTVSGNLGVTGNLSVNGNTTIGDASSDSLTINSNSVSIPNGLNIDSNTLVVDATNNRIGIVNATPLKALDVIGDITYSLQLLNSDGSVSLPSITFNNDNNSGLYRIGSDKIGFSANGIRQGEFGVGYGGFTGNIIQVAYNEITTSSTFSNVRIPIDNTIPQQTEGTEILTCSITPRYSNSILYVESNIYLGENSNWGDDIIIALFRDSTADAVSVSMNNSVPSSGSGFGAAMNFGGIYLLSKISSSSTNITTFKIRAGSNSSSGSGSLRINGSNASQWFNGTLISYLRIMEVQS